MMLIRTYPLHYKIMIITKYYFTKIVETYQTFQRDTVYSEELLGSLSVLYFNTLLFTSENAVMYFTIRDKRNKKNDNGVV